jgi:PAS domain S-box-containing protein
MGTSLATFLTTYLFQAAGNVFLAIVLLSLWRTFRREYLRDWGWSWLALAAYHVLAALAIYAREGAVSELAATLRLLFSCTSIVAGYWQLAWLFQGTREAVSGRRVPARTFAMMLLALAIAAVAVYAATEPVPREFVDVRLFARIGLRSLAAAVVLTGAGYALFRAGRREGSLGQRLLAAAFFLYGLDQLHYASLFIWGLFAPWPYDVFPYNALVDFGLQVGVGLGMTVWLLESEHRRAVRATEALRREHRFTGTLLDTVGALVVVLDPKGRVVRFNRACERLTGVDAAAAEGRPFWEFFPEPAEARQARALFDGEGTPLPGVQESAWQGGDGRRHWVVWSHTELRDARGAVEFVLATGIDVSERRRAEEDRRQFEARLQQTQKQESLGVLAGGVAHDFNNLLTAILGYADLALRGLPPDSPARDNLTQIVGGARRAAELARQMLAYAGKGTLVVQPVRLSRLVRDMADLLKVSISKKCALWYLFADNLPAIEGDPTQLRQVIMNLVINASEAIGDREGTITVRTEAVTCDRAALAAHHLGDGLREGRYVCLEVSDTGGGMAEETRARIFDPFFTTKFTGRGLGLATVLGIVRAHRGAIQVRSEPGRGTTFRILFHSLQTAEVLAVTPAERTPVPPGQGTVLVVDDEPFIRDLARQMLEAAGFAVLTAADGREAVEVYRAQGATIGVVLLDLTMPRQDGVETFHALRRIRPDVRVVLCSGYGDQEASKRFSGHDLAGFVAKPFQLEELLRAVRDALAGRPAPGPGTGTPVAR